MTIAQTYQIIGMHSGMTFGAYRASSWRQALEVWAKEAGYNSYAEFAKATEIKKTEFDGVRVRVW